MFKQTRKTKKKKKQMIRLHKTLVSSFWFQLIEILSLTKVCICNFFEKISTPGLGKFNAIFWARDFTCAPIEHTKPKYVSKREPAGNISFCSLLPKQDWWLSFLMYFYLRSLQWGFCSFRQLPQYCLNV